MLFRFLNILMDFNLTVFIKGIYLFLENSFDNVNERGNDSEDEKIELNKIKWKKEIFLIILVSIDTILKDFNSSVEEIKRLGSLTSFNHCINTDEYNSKNSKYSILRSTNIINEKFALKKIIQQTL